MKKAKESIKSLRSKIVLLEQELGTINKSLVSATSSKDNFWKMYSDLKTEIEDIHSLLDDIPNAPLRVKEINEYPHKRDVKLISRVVTSLITRNMTIGDKPERLGNISA